MDSCGFAVDLAYPYRRKAKIGAQRVLGAFAAVFVSKSSVSSHDVGGSNEPRKTDGKQAMARVKRRGRTWLPRPLISRFLAYAGFAFASAHAEAQTASYTHFEARHTHSIALTPDGTKLLACNTPDSRLSVFDVSSATNVEPTLIAEIPVGLESVSVRARTNDEAWVVSELGDSVSIVSLSRGVVIDTLSVPDEPADVVFLQGKAFVTCARNNTVRVFDAVTRAELASIPLQGNYPRALAADPASGKIYAAFLLSGNNTTTIPYNLTTSAERLTHSDPLMPLPPNTALIVPSTDSRVPYTVLDRDVAEIDAATGTVTRYLSGAGTNLFDLAVHPVTGDLWVANTNARNTTRFEHDLRGRVVDHRVTKLAASDGAATIYDTNAGFNYVAPMPYAFGRNNSIAQPTGIVFTPDAAHVWVAGFNSDRLAKISSTTGAIVTRVDVRPTGVTSRGMRGPRALALNATTNRLYVLNKLANTISIVSTATDSLLLEVPVGTHDPMPTAIKEGRGFLFDARISGRGIASCASCHLDADLDGLAWDLGDRFGTITVVKGKNLSLHDEELRDRNLHPMKGPMVTQTLRGMDGGAPFHWRGDRPAVQSFNPAFDKLLGGAQLATADIDAMTEYVFTLKHHSNPNLQADGNLPPSFQGGDVIRGKDLFEVHNNHCITCHKLPPGIAYNPSLPPLPDPSNNIDLNTPIGAEQPVKNPSLATVYQRMMYKPTTGGQTISGFGLLHNGRGSSLQAALPSVHPYALDELNTVEDLNDVTAFVMCFSTGTAPSVGQSRTVTFTNREQTGVLAALALFESETVANHSELVVKGILGGQPRSFRFDKTTQLYTRDSLSEASLTRIELLALLGANDALTFQGTPIGYGARLGSDRDANGILDRDEPGPSLNISAQGGGIARLLWPNPSSGWFLQFSSSPAGPWQAITRPLIRSGSAQWLDETVSAQPSAFYRLRRTW